MRSSLRTRYPSGQAVLNPEPKSDAQKTIGFSPGHEKRCEFRRIVTVPKPPYLSAIRVNNPAIQSAPPLRQGAPGRGYWGATEPNVELGITFRCSQDPKDAKAGTKRRQRPAFGAEGRPPPSGLSSGGSSRAPVQGLADFP